MSFKTVFLLETWKQSHRRTRKASSGYDYHGHLHGEKRLERADARGIFHMGKPTHKENIYSTLDKHIFTFSLCCGVRVLSGDYLRVL